MTFVAAVERLRQEPHNGQVSARSTANQQISLLAEHEITQMMTLLDSVAHHLGVEHADSPDMEEVKQDVDPRAVLSAIEHETSGQGTR